MTISIGLFRPEGKRLSALRSGWTALRRVLAWPIRVHRARHLMLQLGALSDHELRDIGLTRQDLRAVSALPREADPSLALRARASARRRRT